MRVLTHLAVTPADRSSAAPSSSEADRTLPAFRKLHPPVTSVFNSARKRDSPLSRKLRSILDKSGLRSQVSQIPDLDQLDVFEKDLPAALDKLRPEPPKLGDPRPASVREHGGAWVPMDDSPHMQPSTRYFIAVQIEGDHQLLTCWPDATDEDLDPVDAEVQEESKDWPESWGSVERDRLKAAEETWQLSTANFPGEDEVWALYTFFDLTPDQEASAGGRWIHRPSSTVLRATGSRGSHREPDSDPDCPILR